MRPAALAKYGTHQETISRRPEQLYTPSDTRLEWPEEGLLFELDSNKCSGGITEVMLGPLAIYGSHQETMGGRLEQVYLPSDSRLDLPEEGPLFELECDKWWEGGGAKCGHYSSHSLDHYLRQAWALGQIWHWCKSL